MFDQKESELDFVEYDEQHIPVYQKKGKIVDKDKAKKNMIRNKMLQY